MVRPPLLDLRGRGEEYELPIVRRIHVGDDKKPNLFSLVQTLVRGVEGATAYEEGLSQEARGRGSLEQLHPRTRSAFCASSTRAITFLSAHSWSKSSYGIWYDFLPPASPFQ